MPVLLPRAIASAPRGALRHSGHRPGSGHGPAADAAGPRPAHGAGQPRRRHACGVHGWARVELARLRSLASASVETPSATHADLCPKRAERPA